MEKRFGRVVIGSGDHIFAARAHAFAASGVRVTIVSRSDALSHALQGQGFGVRVLAAGSPCIAAVYAA